MSNPLVLLLTALLVAVPFTCVAATPWGEKDESDVLREAQTYHIMFTSERDAIRAKSRLASRTGKELFAAFQKLARSESKDPGSAPLGGDLGIVQEGVMVRSFEKALFSLPPETVSEPVKSEFGWHLIYAIDFRETSVRQICATSLAEAAERAQGQERETLASSDALVRTSNFAQRVSQLIGRDWGQPLKDWNDDLAFVQIVPSPEEAAHPKALVHIEYTRPVLSTSPLACRRSVRQEYEIDCDAKLAAPVGRFEYEGRGATGRLLLQSRPSEAERKKYASSTGFHGQLLSGACPR
jgi:PPIC-type PPIASE domain